MAKKSVGRVDDTVTHGANLQAEINIVEIDRKILRIEGAGFPKNIRSGHQAGARDGAYIANDIWKIKIVPFLAREPPKRMPAVFAEPHKDARMLDRAAGIQELGSHRADFGPNCLLDHRIQPIRRDDRHIIIKEEQ